MDHKDHDNTNQDNAKSVLYAVLICLKEALRLLEYAVADEPSTQKDNNLPDKEQEILQAVSEIVASASVPENPSLTSCAQSHMGIPLSEQSPEQDKRKRRSDYFEEISTVKNLFKEQQWVVLCAYYRDGLTEEQIALKLGISRSSVYGFRKRGEKAFSDHIAEQKAKLREEQFRLARKYTN